MYGIHKDLGMNGVLFSLILEFVFLGVCMVFVGLGLSELKKGRDRTKNWTLLGTGIILALLSVYVTVLFIQG